MAEIEWKPFDYDDKQATAPGDLPGCPVSCDDDCETDCHALHQPRWTQINIARDCREPACPARSEDEPLRHDLDPCPGGCGGLTDDPYGGPCTRCWNTIGSTP